MLSPKIVRGGISQFLVGYLNHYPHLLGKVWHISQFLVGYLSNKFLGILQCIGNSQFLVGYLFIEAKLRSIHEETLNSLLDTWTSGRRGVQTEDALSIPCWILGWSNSRARGEEHGSQFLVGYLIDKCSEHEIGSISQFLVGYLLLIFPITFKFLISLSIPCWILAIKSSGSIPLLLNLSIPCWILGENFSIIITNRDYTLNSLLDTWDDETSGKVDSGGSQFLVGYLLTARTVYKYAWKRLSIPCWILANVRHHTERKEGKLSIPCWILVNSNAIVIPVDGSQFLVGYLSRAFRPSISLGWPLSIPCWILDQ